MQRHEVKNPNQRANRETFPLQQQVNKVLVDLARKHDIKLVCTNDVHFVDEENAEAHDRLICLSTGRDLDDPNRMLYSKQEWFKTKEEMSEIFSDYPEALANTCEVLDKEFSKEIELGEMFPMKAEYGLATVAIVGENMKHTPGIAGKLFGALGRSGISVIACAQGASETNISFVVNK